MSEEYSVYSKFDMKKHKEHFVHYLEVVIGRNGNVMYAVPSHQELLIKVACVQREISRDELNALCPQEYYGDFMVWLSMITGCVAVWNDFCVGYETSPEQERTLRALKINGLYKGPVSIKRKQLFAEKEGGNKKNE